MRNGGCLGDKNLFLYFANSCSIDATKEDKSLGRLINHSRQHSNLIPQVVEDDIDGKSRVIFKSSKDVNVGDELLYDYGERRRECMKELPWLKSQ